jgi:hypothetical protein
LNRRQSTYAIGLVIALAAGAVIFSRVGSRPQGSSAVQTNPQVARAAQMGGTGRSRGRAFYGVSLPNVFLNGQDMTLSQATAVAGPIPRPQDPFTPDTDITHVYVDTSTGQPQIRVVYASGVYVEIEAAPSAMSSPSNRLKLFEEVAKEDSHQTNGQAQVTEVNGAPAYLIPDHAAVYANGESQERPGSVEFVLGKQDISVVGHLTSTGLIRIASSVA